jgi:hypothetical protein
MVDTNTTIPLSELLLYAAVKLVRISNGKPNGSGTGFYYTILAGDLDIPLIVTNKHVIEGCTEIKVTCHLTKSSTPTEPSGEFIDLLLKTGSAFLHPDSEVDLCAIPVGPLCHQAEVEIGRKIFRATFTREQIPDATTWAGLAAIEEVTMVGCPSGIFDEVNNLPIFRRGITASAPSKLYNGKAEFMVDMACYPGSSGSPVVILNQGTYFAKGGINVGSRFHFLGVLYAGPVVTNQGIVLGTTPKVAVQAMMHLGQVIRSTELLVLEQKILSVLPKPDLGKL